MKNRVIGLFFLCTLFYFGYRLALLLLAVYQPSEFDGALRLLGSIYTTRGLVPYRDFGFVYPPGFILLIGEIFPFTSIMARNFITGVLFLGFILLSAVILCKTTRLIKSHPSCLFLLAQLLLLASLILRQTNESEPFSLILMVLTYLVFYAQLLAKRLGKISCILLFYLGFLSIFFRFDWILLFVLAQIALLIGIVFSSWVLRVKTTLRRYTLLVFTLASGYGAGLVVLGLYLQNLGILTRALDFIITIPGKVIMPYRQLPLPPLALPFHFHSLVYVVIFVGLALTLLILKHVANLWKSGVNMDMNIQRLFFLLTLPLPFLPYALGRADAGHAIPLFIGVAMMGMLLFVSKQIKLGTALFLLLLLYLPLFKFLLPSQVIKPNLAQITYNQDLFDCKKKITQLTPKSIFVGRERYEKYLWNAAALYLLFPSINPATAYISDEPGLQSSCLYGEQIASQLRRAKKPMLAFIDPKDQGTELNQTRIMKSCGRIEKYLTSAPYMIAGYCSAYGRSYEIRIYH